jgi:hypothetical protein
VAHCAHLFLPLGALFSECKSGGSFARFCGARCDSAEAATVLSADVETKNARSSLCNRCTGFALCHVDLSSAMQIKQMCLLSFE